MKGGMVLLFLLLVGCGNLEKFKIPSSSYPANYPVRDLENVLMDGELISGSFNDFPLNELWRILPNNVSYAFSNELSGQKINMELSNVKVSDFFALIAQQLGVDYTQDENIYYVGKIDYKQFSVFVSRLEGFDQSEIKQIVDGIKSTEGKSTFIKGGIFMLSDRWASIQRINAVLKKIKGIQMKNYDVNIWLVNESLVKSFYLKNGLSGKYSFDWLAGHTISYSNWSILITEIAEYSMNVGNGLGVRQFSAIVQDGKEFIFSSGEKVPVLQKTVSSEGTISTTGVDYVDVGTMVKASFLRVDDFSCNMVFSCELSNSSRQIEGYPVKVSNKYDTVSLVKHGEVVVVGRYDVSDKQKYILGYEDVKSSFYVVCSVNVR